jgi:ubiquinone/menaquinone biosynthesis C-methylase UbiE
MQDFVQQKQWLFDRWAASYDFLFPSVFYQATHLRLLAYVNLLDQPNVLDLGCGTGKLLDRFAAHFPTLQGTGLDLSAEMLHQARRCNRHRPRLIYVQGQAETLPFATAQFDAVFNSFSLLHYAHPRPVLQEIQRVLKPEGQFYLVDFSIGQQAQPVHLPVSPGGIRFYSPLAREQLGQQVGLRCLNHHHLLGAVVLSVFAKA